MIEYFGLFGLAGVGLTVALLLSILASRLRRATSEGEASDATSRASSAHNADAETSPSTSRYFLLAVVGLALHAGAFYFYLWGASVRTAGLPGLLVMVMLGFCLITGVFYSWARGTVSYPSTTSTANEASTLAD